MSATGKQLWKIWPSSEGNTAVVITSRLQSQRAIGRLHQYSMAVKETRDQSIQACAACHWQSGRYDRNSVVDDDFRQKFRRKIFKSG